MNAVSFKLSGAKGESRIVALLGASGSGKTTFLQMLAGLDVPDDGRITYSARVFNAPDICLPAHRRRIGMVFQGQLLWPHMTLEEHLRFVMQEQRFAREEMERRISEYLTLMHLTERRSAYPGQLSGGEAQRISLARALITEPEILLLDEPCANLDTVLKREWLALLRRMRAERRFRLAVYVSHDPAEVSEIADEVLVMLEGRVVQRDSFSNLLMHPKTEGVVRLMGNGSVISVVEEGALLKSAFGEIGMPSEWSVSERQRPQRLFVSLSGCRITPSGGLQGIVQDCYPEGREFRVVLNAHGQSLQMHAATYLAPGVTCRFDLVENPRLLA